MNNALKNQQKKHGIKMKNVFEIKKIDTDLISQFKRSLEDVKLGKIKRVA